MHGACMVQLLPTAMAVRPTLLWLHFPGARGGARDVARGPAATRGGGALTLTLNPDPNPNQAATRGGGALTLTLITLNPDPNPNP